tara:strand:+ start:4777 stop:5568 length:792 start_codon:yes stop_codon:yes gene_type:complete
MDKLVYGLGAGLIYSCGGGGTYKKILPKLLNSFSNPVLVSTIDMPFVLTKQIYEIVGEGRLFLDSGGFTLFKKQSTLSEDDFEKLCEKIKKKFLKMCSIAKYHMIFELDNEYFRNSEDLLCPSNYCRQEVYEITGFYPTPVFKLHQGFQYWKGLCDSEIYPTLAIGGLAQNRAWHTNREELLKMMNYARQCGKKVHLLGCQNVETFKLVKPDTVDYSIFQYAINLAHAKKEHPELKAYADLKVHAALYAFARAKSRSFLYDTF